MEPWQSWVLLGAVGAGAAYYYASTGQKKRSGGRSATIAEIHHMNGSKPRNDSKDKRKKEKEREVETSSPLANDARDSLAPSLTAGGAENTKKRKKRGPASIEQTQSSKLEKEANREPPTVENDEEQMNDLEFAKQLNSAQVGTSLKNSEGPPKQKKNKKKGKSTQPVSEIPNGHTEKANGTTSSNNVSGTSSTTGAEADDDLSPANSPELAATSATTPSGIDVTDMLEAPPKGPSVLRLTAPTDSPSIQRSKSKSSTTEVETKKQRQNRRKREEQKILREETEKARRVLLEKQLRTAREAEGRPAKNGLGPSQSQSNGVWKASSATQNTPANSIPESHVLPLLDTLEDNQSAASSSGVGPHNFPSTHVQSYQDLPSEEEQIRMLSEMDSDNTWSTVNKSGKVKKKAEPTQSREPPVDHFPEIVDSVDTPDPQHTSQTTKPQIDSHSDHVRVSKHNSKEDRSPENEAFKPDGIARGRNRTATSYRLCDPSGFAGDTKLAKYIAEGYISAESLLINQQGHQANGIRGIRIGNYSGASEPSLSKTPVPSQPSDQAAGSLVNSTEVPNAETSKPLDEVEDQLIRTDEEAAAGNDIHASDLDKSESGAMTTTTAQVAKESVVPTEKSMTKAGDAKTFGFPKHENLYSWQYDGDDFKEFIARNKRIKKNLDRTIWNYDNIHQHPYYDERWPYALIGHPMDSQWEACDDD